MDASFAFIEDKNIPDGPFSLRARVDKNPMLENDTYVENMFLYDENGEKVGVWGSFISVRNTNGFATSLFGQVETGRTLIFEVNRESGGVRGELDLQEFETAAIKDFRARIENQNSENDGP